MPRLVIDEEVDHFGFGFCGNMEPTCHLEGEEARFQLLFVMLSTVHF